MHWHDANINITLQHVFIHNGILCHWGWHLYFLREHFCLWHSFKRRCSSMFCLIYIRQYTDSWEKCSWTVKWLWAPRVSLINSHRKRPQQRCVSILHKSSGSRNIFRVIYFIPESCSSLAFNVVSVSQLFEHPVGSACSHRSAYSTTVVCIAKEYAHASVAGECVCLLSEGGGRPSCLLETSADLWFITSCKFHFVLPFLVHQYFRYPLRCWLNKACISSNICPCCMILSGV